MNTIVPAGTRSGDAVYDNVAMPGAMQGTHNPNPQSSQHAASSQSELNRPPSYRYILTALPGPVRASQLANVAAIESVARQYYFLEGGIDKLEHPPMSILRAVGAERQRLQSAARAKTAPEKGVLEFPPGADVSQNKQSDEAFGLTEIQHAYIETSDGEFVDVFDIDDWYLDYDSQSVLVYKPRLPTEKPLVDIEAIAISDDETFEDPTVQGSPDRGTTVNEKKRRRSSPTQSRNRMTSNELFISRNDAYLSSTKQYREWLRRPIEGIVEEDGQFFSIDEKGSRKRVYYHHLIRRELLSLANPRNEQYRDDPAEGPHPYDQTAYLSSQKEWSGDLDHVPDIAFQFDPPPQGMPPSKPSQLLYKGCLLLDLESRAMISWPCLPLTTSSALEGWRWLAWTRMERGMSPDDIVGRMPKGNKFHTGTYQDRSSRFRKRHSLYAWYQRGPEGSLSRLPFWKRLPQSARDNNSTRGVPPMSKEMRDEVRNELALARRVRAAGASSTGQGDEHQPIEITDSEEEADDNPLPILDL